MEKLQQTLNKCIEMGWKPRGRKYQRVEARCYPNRVLGKISFINGDSGHLFGPHDLFSKDSGLMEFVDWKNPVEFLPKSRYIAMCGMTEQEKINYFNENSLLPIY